MPAYETATCALAACVARPHTDVSTARAVRATQERVPLAVAAVGAFRSTSCTDGDWVFVAWLPFVAALAARSSTSVATALTSLLTRERVAQAVFTTEIALGFACIAATAAIALGFA